MTATFGSLGRARIAIEVGTHSPWVSRLLGKSTELLRRRNILRQEEITEEIEVIMLSAGTLA